MKRAIQLFTLLLICISIILLSTGCSSSPVPSTSPSTTAAPKHPMEQFLIQMREADSGQMVVTMYDLPFFGTITMLLKNDGNISYTAGTIISDESYTETINDQKYEYKKNDDGKWEKTLVEKNEDDHEDSGNDFAKLIENPENFEAVEGKENTYKQKSGVVFEGFDNVIVTIEKDSCTIEMMMITEDLTCRCLVVISHIGAIELTLPEVTE